MSIIDFGIIDYANYRFSSSIDFLSKAPAHGLLFKPTICKIWPNAYNYILHIYKEQFVSN